MSKQSDPTFKPNERKTKKVNICLYPTEYAILDQIRQAHDKSISELIRDAICFYSLYYANPNDLTDPK